MTNPSGARLGFGRHSLAVLGATLGVATLLASFAGLMVGLRVGAAPGLGIALYVWLGTFLLALPAAGLVFTLAWPLLRRAPGNWQAIAVALGLAAGFAMIWTNYAMVGRTVPLNSLAVATLLGAVGGAFYWRIGVGIARSPRPAPAVVEATAFGL